MIVAATDGNTLARVRSIEPGAFRTTVGGRSVIQVGLFQDVSRANEVYGRLAAAGIPAQIVQGAAPVTQSPPTPNIPNIPAGRIRVVLDPGHGGNDPGAIGQGGLQEKEINLAIARRVQQVLEQRGVAVIMTRTNDLEIDLQPRVDQAEQLQAHLFVSIHANAISLDRPDVNGLETYYFDSGLGLAQTIHNSILRGTNLRDRGVRQARFYVLRNTSMPSVLVETGFVTGAEDAARFRDPAQRDQVADAIAAGILAYVQQTGMVR